MEAVRKAVKVAPGEVLNEETLCKPTFAGVAGL